MYDYKFLRKGNLIIGIQQAWNLLKTGYTESHLSPGLEYYKQWSIEIKIVEKRVTHFTSQHNDLTLVILQVK
ncbi:MAG: hypothetical protein ONB05_06140 [candidate division KSB1 bacterium]|nr:hypothetical protein [candidate division KSB1 bacterium]